MATAAVAALRAHWPDAVIDFAVGPWSRVAVEHNPRIDRLVDCGSVGSGSYSVTEWLSLVSRVRSSRYEVCVVLDRSPLLSLVPALAGVPLRAGLDSDGRGFALNRRVSLIGIQHEVDLYLACVRALGVPTNEVGLEFSPTQEAMEKAASLFPENGEGYIVVHPAGGQNPGMVLTAKRWPVERFAILLQRVIAQRPERLVIVGGPADQELALRLWNTVGCPERVLNLVGELSFDELGALLQRAKVFIGHDTGAMHLATAVGTPVIAIFGPSNPYQYGPYRNGRVVWNPPACAPCLSRGRWNEGCTQFRCIEAVEVENVQDALNGILP